MGVVGSNTCSGKSITSSPNNADLPCSPHIILGKVYWMYRGCSVKADRSTSCSV